MNEINNNQSLEVRGKLDLDKFVYKSNTLINQPYKLTTCEKRIIYVLASNINKDDAHFNTVIFKIADLAQSLGIEKGKSFYKDLRDLTMGLVNKGFAIKKQQNNKVKEEIQISWLSSAKYINEEGILKLEFSEELRPFLLELKEYTKFPLEIVLSFNSFYTSRIYELLKQYYPNIKERTFKFDELKNILGLKKLKSYEIYNNFKQKVILVSQNELKEKSDIYFEFEEIKTGKKITEIKFKIFENIKDKVDENQLSIFNKESQPVNSKLIDLLLYYGLNEKQVKEHVQKYSEERINNNIEYSLNYIKTKEVKNFPGFVITAIDNDYGNKSPFIKAEEEKIKKQKEEAEKESVKFEQEREQIENFKKEYKKEYNDIIDKVLNQNDKEILTKKFEDHLKQNNPFAYGRYQKDNNIKNPLINAHFQNFIIKNYLDKKYHSLVDWVKVTHNIDLIEKDNEYYLKK